MLGEPPDNLCGGLGGDEDLFARGRDPLSDVGTELVCAPGRSLFAGPALRACPRFARRARCRKPEAQQDSPSLMRREIGAIQARELGDHLLRWIPAATDHHVVLIEWFREDLSHCFGHGASLKLEAIPGDDDRPARPCSGFSDLSLRHGVNVTGRGDSRAESM